VTSYTDPMWSELSNAFPGGIGSEGGIVRLDQEHSLGARITLEEGGTVAPWSITCGIYGQMFHTRFFASEDDARKQFALMQTAIAHILDLTCMTSADEDVDVMVSDAIDAFVRDFP